MLPKDGNWISVLLLLGAGRFVPAKTTSSPVTGQDAPPQLSTCLQLAEVPRPSHVLTAASAVLTNIITNNPTILPILIFVFVLIPSSLFAKQTTCSTCHTVAK
jgi:hypothetical protein